ncbi:MAG: hypothetical protein K2P81_08995 [Bacteriovoracaceae bacterium]|nr:hypothetical protein [Bacteriovoracaceae bacterium]
MASGLLKFFSLILLSTGLASALDVSSLDIPGLFEKVKTEGTCSSMNAARLCRHFPWKTRRNEGAIDRGAIAFVFLQAPPSDEPALNGWISKFSPDKRLEYTSYFAVAQPDFITALEKTPYVSLYVVTLETSGGKTSPTSVLLIGKGTLSASRNQYPELAAELNSSQGEWIPPETFAPQYEFVSLLQ